MDTKPIALPPNAPAPSTLQSALRRVKVRMLGGLLFILPILITLWLIHWLYAFLTRSVIDPLAHLVIWKLERGQLDDELPAWCQTYAAPLIAVVLVLVLLYCLGFCRSPSLVLIKTEILRSWLWAGHTTGNDSEPR